MPLDINALASQAAAQGQAQLNDYTGKAKDYRTQYGTYQAQADAANKSVGDYTEYMKNEGSAGNQYNKAFETQKSELGYDPEQMKGARANLNQATGALSAYSDFANTSASKWGMNAGGFAAANAGALGSLNNNIASNQGMVDSLADLYKTAQTGANQFTGQVIQGQHETLGGLQQVFANAADQRDSAASMMNFYDDLASKQGGLNAQQQTYYAQAKQAYAASSAAMAQAALYGQQAAQIQQQIQQGKDYMGSGAYQKYLRGGDTVINTGSRAAPSSPTPNSGGGGAGYNWTDPSSSWKAATSRIGNTPSVGNSVKGAANVLGAGVSSLGWLGKKAWNG